MTWFLCLHRESGGATRLQRRLLCSFKKNGRFCWIVMLVWWQEHGFQMLCWDLFFFLLHVCQSSVRRSKSEI